MEATAPLTDRIFSLARGGAVVTLDEATATIFGPEATKEDRAKVRAAVDGLVMRRTFARAERGAFRLAPPDEEPEPEPVQLPQLLNAFAIWENQRHLEFHEFIAEFRRLLAMRQEAAEQVLERPGFFRVVRMSSTSTITRRQS